MFRKIVVLLHAKWSVFITKAFNNESVMMDIRNPKLEDFKHIETSVRESATRKTFASFYRVKPGCNVIPRTEHKVTKLPEGIL